MVVVYFIIYICIYFLILFYLVEWVNYIMYIWKRCNSIKKSKWNRILMLERCVEIVKWNKSFNICEEL